MLIAVSSAGLIWEMWDHYVAKTRASWQRVHPALTQWVVHRLLEEARAAGFLRAELALLKNLNIGGLNLRVEYDALRRAHLQTLGRPPADDWLSPAPVCQGRREIRPCGGAKVYHLSGDVQRKCPPTTGVVGSP